MIFVYPSNRLQSAAPKSAFQEDIPRLESICIEEEAWPGILTLPEDSAIPCTQAAQTALVDLGTAIASYEQVSFLSVNICCDRSERLPPEDRTIRIGLPRVDGASRLCEFSTPHAGDTITDPHAKVTTILLDQLSCPVCTDHMSKPFTYVASYLALSLIDIFLYSCPCGHTCCATCLATWFRRELRSSLKGYSCLPAGVRNQEAPRTQLEGTKLRRILPPGISRHVFTYTCPLCRAKVIDQPQVTDISKGLVTCFKTTIQPHLIRPVDEAQGSASLFHGLFPKRYPDVVDLTT